MATQACSQVPPVRHRLGKVDVDASPYISHGRSAECLCTTTRSPQQFDRLCSSFVSFNILPVADITFFTIAAHHPRARLNYSISEHINSIYPSSDDTSHHTPFIAQQV
ncbi:hypothetical protein NX059_009740 [Plenodomus lindquistii]|nr:hypothetical protein NX059_009740 [Plenodomus lindquistii]